MKTETPQMDWGQVALNGGPPCFHVEGPQYCGRAERWQGHGNKAFHDFVSLGDLLDAERERCAKIADERAAFNARLRDGYKRQQHQRLADFKEMRKEEAETIAAEIRGHDPREEEEALRQAAMADDEREQEPNRW